MLHVFFFKEISSNFFRFPFKNQQLVYASLFFFVLLSFLLCIKSFIFLFLDFYFFVNCSLCIYFMYLNAILHVPLFFCFLFFAIRAAFGFNTGLSIRETTFIYIQTHACMYIRYIYMYIQIHAKHIRDVDDGKSTTERTAISKAKSQP